MANRTTELVASEFINTPPDQFPAAAGKYKAVLPPEEWKALESWLTTFYGFQLDWLFEMHRRAAAVKARQIGWSHTTAANAVIWGAYHGELTTVISIGEREALEVLDKASKHASVLTALGSAMARPLSVTKEEIRFASGGRIMALPSSGGRGYTGNLILDEFAYHPNQKKLWDSAVPATNLGGYRVRVVSTPNGTGDDYHQLIDSIEAGATKGYALHKVTIHDAIRYGFPVDLEECWAIAKGDPRLFGQMFECSFLDGELQYIPGEDVAACAELGEKIPRFVTLRDGGYGFFGGLDIGETHDRTVLIVVFMDRTGKRWVQWQRSCKRTDFRALEAMVAEAFRTFGLRRLCVDTTGLGTFEGQRLKAKYGELVVEAVKFSEQSKEELATHLYTAITKRLLVLAKKDGSVLDLRGQPALPPGAAKEIMDDICKIKRIITAAGNVRYDAPRTAAGHADNAWALGLALHACSLPIPNQNPSAGLPSMA